jgi:hypothetical protein
MAWTIESTFAGSRPSEKFGTHSINRFIVSFRLRNARKKTASFKILLLQACM